MPLEVSIKLKYFHQGKRVKTCKPVKRFPDYSKFKIDVYSKLPDEAAKIDHIN